MKFLSLFAFMALAATTMAQVSYNDEKFAQRQLKMDEVSAEKTKRGFLDRNY